MKLKTAVETPQPADACTGELGMFALLEAAHALEERVEGELGELGLSIPKYMTLRHLVAAGGGMSLSALADTRRCVRSNITQLVDRLVADGFVERVSDPADRRAVVARITAVGQKRVAAATRAMQAIERDVARHVPDAERTHFAAVMAAFRQA